MLKSWTPGLRLTPAARRTREALAQAQAVPPVPRCVVFLPGRAAASVTRSLGDSPGVTESRSESLRLPVAVTVPGQPDSVSLRGRLRLTGSRYPGLAGPPGPGGRVQAQSVTVCHGSPAGPSPECPGRPGPAGSVCGTLRPAAGSGRVCQAERGGPETPPPAPPLPPLTCHCQDRILSTELEHCQA